MKRAELWNSLQPLYVLAASLVGLVITLCLFVWFYPHSDARGQALLAVPQFWVWVLLLAVQAIFFTIVLAPAWLQFIALLREQMSGTEREQRAGTWIMLVLGTLFFLLLMGSVNLAIGKPGAAVVDASVPPGHTLRVQILTAYGAIAALPILLGMLLIYTRVHAISEQLDVGGLDEGALFGTAQILLRYRRLLQTSLLVLGIMVSILPVATGALREILVALGKANDKNYPLTLLASYGLFYTLVLVVFYVPVHLLLADASRKLRDRLCPIDDLNQLEENLRKRAALDEWLETNTSLMQNLRAGVVTLFPLLASLAVSLLGPNVKIP